MKKSIINNICRAVFSNVFASLSSVLGVVLFPKVLSSETYGYWQLFLFYLSFVGFLHFGWEDGIYLRYAGICMEKIDKKVLSGQLIMLFIVQCLFGGVIVYVAIQYFYDKELIYILLMIGVLVPIVNLNNMFNFLFQITNMIEKYSNRLILEKIFFLLSVLICYYFEPLEHHALIQSQALALLFVFLLGMKFYSNILIFDLPSINDVVKETKNNIKIGINLMLANISNILMLGIVRWGISECWSIEVFGKISLSLSIANFFMVAINAVGIALFPIFKKMRQQELKSFYIKVRNTLMPVCFFLMLIYYPASGFVLYWLPNYKEIIEWMIYIFPVGIFECRVILLTNTYLKSLRKEKVMLLINGVSTMISCGVTLLGCLFFHDLTFMMIGIVFIFAFRCILMEIYLWRVLELNFYMQLLMELIMVISFIILNIKFSGIYGGILYSLVLGMYLYFQRNMIRKHCDWQNDLFDL